MRVNSLESLEFNEVVEDGMLFDFPKVDPLIFYWCYKSVESMESCLLNFDSFILLD